MKATDARSFDAGHPLRIAVLVSGGGTTLENLLRRIADGRLRHVRIELTISSRADVRAVAVARDAGLPVEVVDPRRFDSLQAFSDAIAHRLRDAGVQLAVMGGFLHLWRIPADFVGRVLNIHPALLPDFGGRGMYGLRVHRAVLEAGVPVSGCTVHIADDAYDHGPIIAQMRVPVRADDTPETLARRVRQAEFALYPCVIQQVADAGLRWLDDYLSPGGSAQAG